MVDSAPVRRIPISGWPRALALAAALLASCAAEPAPGPVAAEGPGVVLISLDGTRPEDVIGAGLPAFDEIARLGARAERLVPVFPTNTFPNHVTLVTGVRPALHGIVNNAFADPERGLFRYGGDPGWIEVEPLWSWVGRHGVVSASYHWVGSEGAWTSGRGPRHWKRFDGGTPEAEKVEQILAWLDEPDPAARPRLVTAWFHGADHEAHEHGPGSAEARRALREQDAAVGELLRGLRARDALGRFTLVLVSDHGMAPVRRWIDLQQRLDEAGVRARVLGGGGFASLALDAGALAGALRVAREQGLEAWPREEAPAELGLDHPRFGDAVVLAPPGTAIGRHGGAGGHGYRPERPEMSAFLLAVGRGAEPGEELGRLRALDVAPTLLALLGVPRPEWMEGRPVAALVPDEALP